MKTFLKCSEFAKNRIYVNSKVSDSSGVSVNSENFASFLLLKIAKFPKHKSLYIKY